jgi:hypothetical protein
MLFSKSWYSLSRILCCSRKIATIGEEDCSIELLLEDMGNIWGADKQAIGRKPRFSLAAERTELNFGDEIRLLKRSQQKYDDFYIYLYVAGPKQHVNLYRKNGVFRLKVNVPPQGVSERNIAPYVRLTGLLPNGYYVESDALNFSVV